MKTISELIKRNPRGLTVEQVALKVGLSHRNSLAYYMRNPGRITFSLVRKLSSATGVPVRNIVRVAIDEVKAKSEQP